MQRDLFNVPGNEHGAAQTADSHSLIFIQSLHSSALQGYTTPDIQENVRTAFLTCPE
jgi:hypothetical protein